MGVITYNNKSSADFGIQVEHYPSYDIPERDYEMVHVPGRNGDIYIDKGSYKNVQRDYEIAVGSYDEDGFIQRVRALVAWLCSHRGYAKLSDTYEPDCYRLAAYKDSNTIENILNKAGRATISFDCKPQRFLVSGDVSQTFTSSGTLTNPTAFESKPIITVSGVGYGELHIGEEICYITLLDYSVNNSIGVTRVRIDGEQFMSEVGDEPEESYSFVCDGNRCSSVISSTASNPITIEDMAQHTTDFISKIGTNALESYKFIFNPELKGAAIYDSANITAMDISDATLPSTNTVEELWYCSRIDAQITSRTGIEPGDIIFNNVDNFISGIRDKLKNDQNFGTLSAEISYNNGDWYCKGEVVDLSSLGLTVAEEVEFQTGDKFIVTITTYWKTDIMNEGTVNYPYGVKCNGLADFNDSILVYFYPEYWTLSGFEVVPSDYGIIITGQPIEGDTITITVNAIWKLDNVEISISDYGITTYGTPEANDTIEVLTEGSVVIDSEQKDCYIGEKNKNYDVRFQNGFPEIPSGEVSLSFTGGITEVEVIPKWWTI